MERGRSATPAYRDSWRGTIKTRCVVSVLLVIAPYVVSGQAPEWQDRFAAGKEARQLANVATCATEMAAPVRAMPTGHLNRPLVQYHAARADTIAGRGQEGAAWLRQARDEDVDPLMISSAPHDLAFEEIRDQEGFREVMDLAAEMELKVRSFGGSAHLIQGAGANVVVQLGADGVLPVDMGYGPALPALRTA